MATIDRRRRVQRSVLRRRETMLFRKFLQCSSTTRHHRKYETARPKKWGQQPQSRPIRLRWQIVRAGACRHSLLPGGCPLPLIAAAACDAPSERVVARRAWLRAALAAALTAALTAALLVPLVPAQSAVAADPVVFALIEIAKDADPAPDDPDDPDSNVQDDAPVVLQVPSTIASSIDKTVMPSSIVGFPDVPVRFNLSATNTSNGVVDSHSIQDPAEPASNAFDCLEVTGLTNVDFPSGADRVQVDWYDGTTWIAGAPTPCSWPSPTSPPRTPSPSTSRRPRARQHLPTRPTTSRGARRESTRRCARSSRRTSSTKPPDPPHC